jgi:hypothetical protein
VDVEFLLQGGDPAAMLVKQASDECAGHVIGHLLEAGERKS